MLVFTNCQLSFCDGNFTGVNFSKINQKLMKVISNLYVFFGLFFCFFGNTTRKSGQKTRRKKKYLRKNMIFKKTMKGKKLFPYQHKSPPIIDRVRIFFISQTFFLGKKKSFRDIFFFFYQISIKNFHK